MSKSHNGAHRSDRPAEGGFGKLVIGAVIIVGLAAGLWFMTPWAMPGNTHMQAEDVPVGQAADGAETDVEAGFYTTADGRRIQLNVDLPERTVVIERDGEEITRFITEITDTPEAQQIGLMGRTELAPDRAMLFTWDPPTVSAMWMKDTLIPLDMLYVRPGGVIVGIAHSVPPCPPTTVRCPAYAAPEPVAHVLEIAGGRAKELGLQPGDQFIMQGDES